MALGKNVKTLRLQKNWTLKELSQRSNVPVGTIGAIEVRDSVRSEYASKLALALGISTDELVTGQSTPNPTDSAPLYTGGANQPLATIEPAQAAIKTIATLAQITEALAGYLMHMDDDGRDDAADILRKLAHKPENHARAATMLTAAFHAPKRKSA